MAKERSGFMKWYFSPQGKKVVGSVYSLGASIVIIGALFKILHWPGASFMLMIGMFTEAILFSLGVLDDPHPDLHWDHIFPALTDKDKDPLVNHLGGGVGGGATSAGMASVTPLKDADVKAMSEGLKSISEAANQIAGISKVAGLTDSFAKNLETASVAAAQFATKQQNLDAASNALLASYSGITENMTTVQANTKVYVEKAESINKNLGAINSVYEIQLKNIQSQTEAVEQQTLKISAVAADVDKVQKAMAVSAVDIEKYKDETGKLAQKVVDLNAIYGNMLNAING
ncbi:MAG: gliding motility protein GldL [Prevotellaceae bacterium]|nr:gliding motility protein GldL [Prevotellaceae bacterium]